MIMLSCLHHFNFLEIINRYLKVTIYSSLKPYHLLHEVFAAELS